MNLQDLIIKEIADIITVHKTSGTTIQMKSRHSYGLSFSSGGKIEYSHNGKIFISDINSVIFHPKNSTYTLTCLSSGNFHLVNFELVNKDISEFMEFKTFDFEFFLQAVNEMKNNSLKQNKKAKNLSILYDILDMLSPIKNNENHILSPAINVINNTLYTADINVSYLAELCHVSECYFRKKFYDTFGKSPKKYLTERRIKYSMQLLKEGYFNISQIAEKSGFNDVYHFSKTFKKHIKISPSEYALKNKITSL